MAIVRCNKHGLPYNDANPRGCPACQQEKTGDDRRELMSALARSTKTGKPIASEPEETATNWDEEPVLITSAPYLDGAARQNPADQPPARQLRPWHFAVGVAAVAIAIFVLLRPNLEPWPALDAGGQVLPLPLQPAQEITVMFAQLGPATPEAVADSPSLARYRYPNVTVDLTNGFVYRIELTGYGRTWERLQVGMPENLARGAIALLGDPTEERTEQPGSTFESGFRVFPSVAERPELRLTTQVRPPNGCFDVTAVLKPQPIGILHKGDQDFAAVARGNDDVRWTLESVEIVNRRENGPLAQAARC